MWVEICLHRANFIQLQGQKRLPFICGLGGHIQTQDLTAGSIHRWQPQKSQIWAVMGQVGAKSSALHCQPWILKLGRDNLIGPCCTGAKGRSAGRRRDREARGAVWLSQTTVMLCQQLPPLCWWSSQGPYHAQEAFVDCEFLHRNREWGILSGKSAFRGWKLKVLGNLPCLKRARSTEHGFITSNRKGNIH